VGGKGSGGCNRKSVEDHLRNGTYKPSRHGPLVKGLVAVKKGYRPPTPGKVTVKIPECPDWLDALAKTEWNRACKRLNDLGLLKKTDISALEGYCAAYSRWRRAEETITERFTYVYVEDKTFKQKRTVLPEAQIAKDALAQMKAYQNDIGLMPKSAVPITKQDKRSEMDKFLDEV
jgi:P27 family predicted phage terminase small subunit